MGPPLDPSVSDAGVVGRVTLSNDTRADRDGTYEIIGVAADGSECGVSFDGMDYIAVAWYDDAPLGEISRMAVTVPVSDIPQEDGQANHDIRGQVSFDVAAESGIGNRYGGDSTSDNSGSASIDVGRSGARLQFDFSATTWDSATFTGQLVCALP